MGNSWIFLFLLISVNALITTFFVRSCAGDIKKFFLLWCGIIFVIQFISIVAAIPLPMQEEGLPFLFAFVAPITVGAFTLNKIIKRMNPDNDKKKVTIWQSLGIMTLAQALSWLASFWFLPKYH